MSKTQARLLSFTGRMLAVAALTTTGGALLYAQTVQSGASAPAVAAAAQSASQTASEQAPKLNLQVPLATAANDAAVSDSSSSSSSSSSDNELAANTTDQLHLMDAMQYGGGNRRYGRPRYRGGNTNADGSPKYDFYGGGGFTLPVGTQSNYLTPSWGLEVGGGRMFNKHAGVNIEFNYDEFGMTGATINNQETLYNNYITLYNQYCASNPSDPSCVANGGGVSPIAGLGGNSHIWSFGIQPIYNVRSGEGMGAYITGGVGFYHKVANFTAPEEEEYCDPYYGICEPIEANAVIDHYTSNAPGFNGGFGVTYKFSRFASERLYAEVRYVYVVNSARAGVDAATCTTLSCASTNSNVANDFPQNSNRTSYIPVKFGIRF